MADVISRKNKASIYLDLARGLAAIEVIMYHMRPTLLANYADIKHHTMFDFLIYAITDKGFQSVLVFFVLSGFFISSSVIKSIIQHKWSWKVYLINRLTRLWLVLIPALFLTYVWNRTNIELYGNYIVTGDMSWSSLMRTVFFLQGTYGNNGALWSLTYEFWYYILFPCLLLIFYSRKKTERIVYATLAIIISVLMGKTMLAYFIVWLFGSALVVLPKLNVTNRWKYGVLTIPFLLFLVALAASKRNHTFVSDLSIGITFAFSAYTWICVYGNHRPTGNTRERLSIFLASFSYTLYLVHFPVNNFMVSIIGERKLQPNLKSYSLMFLVFIGTVVYAWIVSRLTEVHTDKVRSVVVIKIQKILNVKNKIKSDTQSA